MILFNGFIIFLDIETLFRNADKKKQAILQMPLNVDTLKANLILSQVR